MPDLLGDLHRKVPQGRWRVARDLQIREPLDRHQRVGGNRPIAKHVGLLLKEQEPALLGGREPF